MTRNTIQHDLILQAVKQGNHPSADEVYDKVVRICPSISLTTVYRNLNHLVDSGEILKLNLSSTANRFDGNSIPHYHISCTICGGFEDVELPYLYEIDRKIEKDTGYIINEHDMVFIGICPKCKQKE